VTLLFLLRRVDCNDGVASYLETMIKGLTAKGHRIVIASGPVSQHYGSEVRHASILANVAEWLVIDDLRKQRPRVSTVRSVLDLMRRHDVDVISPQGFSSIPIAFLLSLLGRRPVVANYHPSMKGTTPGGVAVTRSRGLKLNYRAIATVCRPARFIAISKEIVGFFQRDCGVAAKRIVYVPHGIDLSNFRPPTADERERARRTHALDDTTLVCVLPGRLNFDKGHDIVIDAVRILRRTRPELEIVCLFPGGGDQADEIKRYAFHDDADRGAFRFLGFLEPAAFRETYWAADIGLLPSRFEGFGYVIAEAMSCGCVPVRTPSGGWDDQIVDGSNGFVVPFNDAEALALRLGELSDVSRRSKMRAEALRFATEHFDQQTMIDATENVYRSVVRR
jgi:glycosyltransferase involved in cell wall biosynthesis